jgi:1-deoxy-D-xylulose-5-phosphate reductoisomerase
MGAKISVDSATMFNKGLELIEAARLFPVPESRIEVLVHPQSTVHGLVQYTDGSVLAQLGTPDMRTPIAHALAWPARMAASVPPLDLIALGKLEFFAPDPVRFPALRLSREALRAGRGAPTILNAANEIAVGLFLEKRLRFLDIAAVVDETLSRLGAPEAADLPAIMAHDAVARSQAGLFAAKRAALV